jgi:hypothetical protein
MDAARLKLGGARPAGGLSDVDRDRLGMRSAGFAVISGDGAGAKDGGLGLGSQTPSATSLA